MIGRKREAAEHVMGLRLRFEDRNRLDRLCRALELSQADVIRKAIKALLQLELASAYREGREDDAKRLLINED